jgi:signal recognition particle receptor subunit beta
MTLSNLVANDLHCKIVYYGPSLGGKSANLAHIYGHAPADSRGELMSLPTETERTLFFDYLPVGMGAVRGHNVRFHLYTVPGQPAQERTRATLLDKVDGIVFVADSGRSRFRDNVESLYEMQRTLSALGRSPDEIPLVFQYNKRDSADAVPVPLLNARLNSPNAPFCLAIASKGVGVVDTLRTISELVIAKL